MGLQKGMLSSKSSILHLVFFLWSRIFLLYFFKLYIILFFFRFFWIFFLCVAFLYFLHLGSNKMQEKEKKLKYWMLGFLFGYCFGFIITGLDSWNSILFFFSFPKFSQQSNGCFFFFLNWSVCLSIFILNLVSCALFNCLCCWRIVVICLKLFGRTQYFLFQIILSSNKNSCD